MVLVAVAVAGPRGERGRRRSRRFTGRRGRRRRRRRRFVRWRWGWWGWWRRLRWLRRLRGLVRRRRWRRVVRRLRWLRRLVGWRGMVRRMVRRLRRLVRLRAVVRRLRAVRRMRAPRAVVTRCLATRCRGARGVGGVHGQRAARLSSRRGLPVVNAPGRLALCRAAVLLEPEVGLIEPEVGNHAGTCGDDDPWGRQVRSGRRQIQRGPRQQNDRAWLKRRCPELSGKGKCRADGDERKHAQPTHARIIASPQDGSPDAATVGVFEWRGATLTPCRAPPISSRRP